MDGHAATAGRYHTASYFGQRAALLCTSYDSMRFRIWRLVYIFASSGIGRRLRRAEAAGGVLGLGFVGRSFRGNVYLKQIRSVPGNGQATDCVEGFS